jgi:hypothetical protein
MRGSAMKQKYSFHSEYLPIDRQSSEELADLMKCVDATESFMRLLVRLYSWRASDGWSSAWNLIVELDDEIYDEQKRRRARVMGEYW